MMCFRDKTFCGSDCTNHDCGRHFGEAEKIAAERWWGGPDAPVAWSDFAPTCDSYRSPDTDTREG